MKSSDRYKRHQAKMEQSKSKGFTRAADALGGAARFGLIAGAAVFGGYSIAKKIGPDNFLSGIGKATSATTRGVDFAKGVVGGFSRTVKSAGWRDTLLGDATKELTSNLTESLRPWAAGKHTKALGGEALRVESSLKSLRFLGRKSEDFAADVVRLRELNKGLDNISGMTDEIRESLKPLMSSNSYAFKAGWQSPINLSKNQKIEDVISKNVDRFVTTNNLSKGFLEKDKQIFEKAVIDLKKNLVSTSDKKAFLKDDSFGKAVQEEASMLRKGLLERQKEFSNKTYRGVDRLRANKFNPKKGDWALKHATLGDLEGAGLLSKKPFESSYTSDLISEIKELFPEADDNFFKDMIADPNLFIGKKGQIIDTRGIIKTADKATDTLSREFQIPFIGIRPFTLVRPIIPHDKNAYFHHIFEAGEVANIGKSFEKTAERTIYFGGSLLDTSGNILEKDLYLTNFGPHKRGLTQMAEGSRNAELFQQLDATNSYFQKARNVADLGTGEQRGILGDALSMVSKYSDEYWTQNIISGIEAGTLDFRREDYLGGVLRKGRRIPDINAEQLSRKELVSAKEALIDNFGEDFYNIITTGSTKDSWANAIDFSVQNKKVQEKLGEAAIRDLDIINQRIKEDPDIFHRIRSAKAEDVENLFDNALTNINFRASKSVTYGDIFSKKLSSEIYKSIMPTSYTSKYDDIGVALRSTFKGLDNKEYDKLLNLDIYNRFQSYGDDKAGLGRMASFIAGWGDLKKQSTFDAPARDRLVEMFKDAEPKFAQGSKPMPFSAVKSDTPFIIRQSKVRNVALEGINESIKSGTFDIKDIFNTFTDTSKQVIKEAGFGKNRAGRGNLSDVTDFTTSPWGAYNLFSRLNEGLGSASVGLSKRHTGSTQNLLSGLFLRRYLLPVAVIGYLGYANDKAGDILGEEPSDMAIKGYASTALGVQKVKDITGLNKLSQKVERILPGSEHLWQSPVGAPIKLATFGALGDNRGYDEYYNYLTEGDEEIRKGRWWSFGSNTPWYGGRVSGHHPSYYRRFIGEPNMTDSQWGSETEYWQNNWLPTLDNPLGPLKTWTYGNKHWENKHKDSRPAAVYGGIPELETIPLVGPIVDATAGKILKPFRKNPSLEKSHRKYLTDINEAIKSEYDMQSRGSIQYITPGGRMTPKGVPTGMPGTSGGYGIPDYSGDSSGGNVGAFTGIPGSSEEQTAITSFQSFSKPGRGASQSRTDLTGINLGYSDMSTLKNIDRRSISGLEDSRILDSLSEAANPNSLGYRMGESRYSLHEVMGLRGFTLNTIFGDAPPSITLQSSSRSFGYERRFWDQEMGGRGSDLSEIVRRFIPHRRRNTQEYNPIRNTMEEWMPSNQNYFQDFLHGDPYLNVTMGEARLPGEGYESINKLHPDKYFGRYGALDRMKILGDVAPWSKQYSYYSGITTQMKEAGLYTDEEYDIAKRTRKKVSARKQKHEFYNYRFKDSKLEEKTVTVDRVIDAFTFTTKEFGAIPIQMAGIKGPKSPNTKEGQEISDLSYQYIFSGAKLKIGYAEDPLKMIKGDVLKSINAVVYSDGKKVQSELIEQSKNIKADYDTEDPAAVHALYGNMARQAGKMWETVAHMDNPISNKFMQVRSPLEMYERNYVYGKDFQTWEHPIKDWVIPTINKGATKNPVMVTAAGALIGSLFGNSPVAKGTGAVVGGLLFGSVSGARAIDEFAGRLFDKDYSWIPKEERKVREVDEYFDKLKYIKYKGLYEKAKRSALKYEGVDVQEIVDFFDEDSGANTKEARYLKKIKSVIKSTMGDSIVDQEDASDRLDDINDRLAEIAGKKRGVKLGPIATQALEYKNEYESTLYGADENGDLLKIFQALPKRDRPFFAEFLKAKPDEREKILSLVPKNQKRFYQAKWGLKIDRKESLTEYFAKHQLPGKNWKGWHPEQNLEESKLKFIESKGLDLSDFGFWATDLNTIGDGTPGIRNTTPSMVTPDSFILDTIKLQGVLEGQGLSNVDIYISKEQTQDPTTPFELNLDIKHDRRWEVSRLFNKNASGLLMG